MRRFISHLPIILPLISGICIETTASQSTPNSPLLSLHKSLCQIPSITGSEQSIIQYLSSHLTATIPSLTVELLPVTQNTSNIYAYLGTTRKTRTLLTSHLDVVPPFINYTFHASNNSISGRGTNDAKGSVAAQITAFKDLLAAKEISEGDVGLLYVIGEETDGAGMISVNEQKNLTWNAVIFGEPTELKLSRGHKGSLQITLEALGKAAHSGYPQFGIDANVELVEALHQLKVAEGLLPGSELFGKSTLNYGVVKGGVAANVVSPYAVASIAVRLAGDVEETKEVIDEALERIEGVRWAYSKRGYGPQILDSDVEGFETETHSYGTDIPNLKGDHKKYLYGPGSILTAHSDAEFVLVSDLEEAVVGYKALLRHTLGLA